MDQTQDSPRRPGVAGIVPRERVFGALDRALDNAVVWVSAPAGSGKSSAVASYLEARRRPFLWYRLDEGDADEAAFLRGLGATVESSELAGRPQLGPKEQGGSVACARRSFRTLFGARLAPWVLVLDDCHRVAGDARLHQALAAGLEEVPKGVNVVCLSRHGLPPALLPLRVSGRLSLVGWPALRLTPEESEAIVARRGASGAPVQAAARAHRLVGGWIAGFVLALGGQAGENAACILFDQFAAELFDQADEASQFLLTETAFLPRMTPQMVEDLTGVADGQGMLEGLIR